MFNKTNEPYQKAMKIIRENLKVIPDCTECDFRSVSEQIRSNDNNLGYQILGDSEIGEIIKMKTICIQTCHTRMFVNFCLLLMNWLEHQILWFFSDLSVLKMIVWSCSTDQSKCQLQIVFKRNSFLKIYTNCWL